jgi:hypothetical protein
VPGYRCRVTFLDVYVGELGADGALDWGGDPRTGNVPHALGPTVAGYAAFARLEPFARERGLPVRRVDWGATAARVGVADIRAFVAECHPDGVPPRWVAFLDSLDPARGYALVAREQ